MVHTNVVEEYTITFLKKRAFYAVMWKKYCRAG